MGQHLLDAGAQLLDPLPGAGRDRDRPGQAGAQRGQGDGVGEVGLVQDDELGHVQGSGDLGQDGAHGGHLAEGVGVGGVDDVQHEVGPGDLLQGGAEGLNELVGQVAHETDGVSEGVGASFGGLGPPDGGVEGGEQGVLNHDAGLGEAVHEGGLAGVGVTGDRHRGDGPAST